MQSSSVPVSMVLAEIVSDTRETMWGKTHSFFTELVPVFPDSPMMMLVLMSL